MYCIDVECDHCQKMFDRPYGRYNEAVKFGWRQFCSPECKRLSKIKQRVVRRCKSCNVEVRRLRPQIEPSGNVFCSHPCSARYINSHRTTQLSIARRARQLAKPICDNRNCNKRIRLANKQFCTTKCRLEDAKYRSQGYVVKRIQDFVSENGRIPIKYEVMKIYSRARLGFGTWNKAIIAAGFEPNPVMFAKQCKALDGHRCDSVAEMIVDDWLYRREIEHQVNIRYPWNNGMTADFVVEETWIEIFGLAGEHKRYDELKKRKLELAKEYQIEILQLTLKDVYRNGIERKLAKLA